VGFLLDTNVVSEARRPRGDEGVKRWIESVPSGELHLSVLAVGEIRRGIERLRRRDPAQAETYAAWLKRLRTDYAERLLPITAEVAEEWGRITASDPVPVIDGLMAATAKVAGMTLVTRNTSDVERTGVRLLNPFSHTRRP
jgi:predicted nucleic acid-binding protein